MRCFIDPSDWTQGVFALSPEESRHAAQVLRCQEGDTLELLDGLGGWGRARVVELAGRQVRVELLERKQVERPAVRLTLIQAVPREQRMDMIIQKATELGVSAIHPVLTEHCVVRLKPAQAAEKADRWRKIAVGAVKQSGALWLPEMAAPASLAGYLAKHPAFDLLLVGLLTEKSRTLREALASARAASVRHIAVLIGPEGDFTADESQQALAAGAVPVTLGPTVLRVETAALYMLSVLRHEFFTHG